MTLDNTSDLWIEANGRVVCPDHAGHYLRTALEVLPHSLHIFTPLGVWMRVTTEPATCEDC